MIIGISNVHTGDLVSPGLLAVGLFLLGYLGKTVIDLWIGHMRHQSRPELLDEYADMEDLADSVRDAPAPYVGFDATAPIAPEDEPSWDEKAPLKLIPYHFALAEQAVVLGGNPTKFDLAGVLDFVNPYLADVDAATPEETSGRHARVDGDDTATGLMPAIDEPAAEEMATS